MKSKIAATTFAVLLASAGMLRAVDPPAATASAPAATEPATESSQAIEAAELDRATAGLRETFEMLKQAIGGQTTQERIKANELLKKFEADLIGDPANYKTRDGKEAFGEKLIVEYRKILTPEHARKLDEIVLRAKTLAEKSYNKASVRGIAMGCNIYAHDNEGKLPDNFGQLVTAGFCAPKQFIKKGSAAKLPDIEKMTHNEMAKWVNENAEYVYLGGGKDLEKLAADYVLLHDKEGTVFGCVDDHVPVLTDEEGAKVLAELKAGKNPPPSIKGK
jgi:hypothetical protein